MAGGGGSLQSACYSKEWDSKFLDGPVPKDGNTFWVDSKRGLMAHGDDFDVFLEDSKSSVPSCPVEELREFCRGVRLKDLESEAAAAWQRSNSWVDDRSPTDKSSVSAKTYKNPMKAPSLYLSLKTEVREVNCFPCEKHSRLIKAFSAL